MSNLKNYIKKHYHTLLIIAGILLIVGIAAIIYLRFKGFINFVTVDMEISDESLASYTDNNDILLPLLDKDGYILKRDVENILVLGNGPFADDYGKKNSLASLLEKSTGANVINCALSGTHATQTDPDNVLTDPLDVYTAYYLLNYMAFPEAIAENVETAYEMLGDKNPPRAREVLDTLSNLDMSEVQVVVIMYDLTDYYENRLVNLDDTEVDEVSFAGSIYRAVNFINVIYPETRIIVSSPYYNPQKDASGEYVSAELVKNDYGTPSNYFYSLGGAIQAVSTCSFLDNYFGTVTEANYSEYLEKDERHLNKAGKELLTKRLTEFITAFN